MPPLPEAIIRVLAPFAPLLSERVWRHAQLLRLSAGGQILVAATAWHHNAGPTCTYCLAVVRRHLWRARYVVTSTPKAECIQCPQAALDLLIHGVLSAA